MKSVLEWLEKTATACPNTTAFADENSAITYKELLEKAKAIGSNVSVQVAPRTPVVLFMEKSVHAICCMFGVLYAGCCYSYMDLRQPAQRIKKILETLSSELVITDKANMPLAKTVFPENVTIIEVGTLASGNTEVDLLDRRRNNALSTDPVYINFTSGSTGNPKGVAVGHSALIDFIPTFVETLGITENDVFACQAPLDFDVSVKDVYSAIYLGSTVHLIPRDYFSEPVRLLDYLCERRPTVLIWAVSAMCFVSIMGGFDYKIPESVRLIAFSGEVMPIKQLRIWRKSLPNATFVNVYGPTEITCNCTYYVISREFELDESIPIGLPFDNERVFLIDENGSEVSESGVVGEIYVGGSTLAIGYYGDLEKTSAAFVQNPLNSLYIDRVYKTGDLAYYNKYGELVYLSRVDHQIKHMGQRIELGEIEAAAHAIDGVTRACCIYDGVRKRIRMFYTGDIGKQEIAAVLKKALPPFMQPNNIKQVSQMPLTKNGKIDRGRLERGEVE